MGPDPVGACGARPVPGLAAPHQAQGPNASHYHQSYSHGGGGGGGGGGGRYANYNNNNGGKKKKSSFIAMNGMKFGRSLRDECVERIPNSNVYSKKPGDAGAVFCAVGMNAIIGSDLYDSWLGTAAYMTQGMTKMSRARMQQKCVQATGNANFPPIPDYKELHAQAIEDAASSSSSDNDSDDSDGGNGGGGGQGGGGGSGSSSSSSKSTSSSSSSSSSSTRKSSRKRKKTGK